jgi:hypothetical protein
MGDFALAFLDAGRFTGDVRSRPLTRLGREHGRASTVRAWPGLH